MDAVTYPNEDVIAFLSENVVAYKPKIDEHEDLAKQFGVVWTPGLVWLTSSGQAAHSNIGYFDPDEFLAESTLGTGHAAALSEDWEQAREHFATVSRRWPKSHAAAAGIYWEGVAGKRASGDAAPLLEAWNRLLADHKGDAWAMKVSFLKDKQ